MKTIKHNLANDELAGSTEINHLGSFERNTRLFARISHQRRARLKTLPLCFYAYIGIGFFTLVPLTSGHGTSGGRSSMMSGHGNEGPNDHRRYFDPFWSPAFLYHAGIYDSTYCYTPSPQQQATAQQQLEAYLQE